MPFGGVVSHAGPMTKEEREVLEAQIRRAYSWSYYDGEIAAYAGCSIKTVTRWRERNGLQSNYKRFEGIGGAAPTRLQ